MAKLIGYVGSKEKLLSVIEDYIPVNTFVIYEPFCGSATVSLSQDVSKYYLADSQPELINFLGCVRDNPTTLISRIQELLDQGVSEELYMALRVQDRKEGFLRTDIYSRAARYFFIVNNGYNNLYRVNGKGQCNTPYAKGKKKIPNDWKERITETSEKLTSNCSGIFEQQFDNKDILKAVIDSQPEGQTAFVFIDPPYYGTYDQYTKERTSEEFWERLYQYLEDLDEAGIPFLMTNSYHEFILEKFGKWNVSEVPVKYTVAADGSKRVKTSEAFITNLPK